VNYLTGLNVLLVKCDRTGICISKGAAILRTTILLLGSFAVTSSMNFEPVFGQESAQTEVTVKIPNAPNHEFDFAIVTVNDRTIRVQPGGLARFNVPSGRGAVLSIQAHIVHTGFGVKTWNHSDTLNGSGYADYSWDLFGGGIFEQWPAVTFEGTVHLDVWIDGAVMGTTEISKGVAPERQHTFEWKNGDSTVCTNKITLPPNVTRIYSCNAATKMIEQK